MSCFLILQTPITYDALMKMDCLEMAINESMRLLPTAPRLERVCKKTVELNGVTIPKDTLVGIPTYVLCRDLQLWESPDEFRPERFSPECKSEMNQYAFMPFGLGPRNCIGMRFAQMIMKLLVVKLLQNFSMETCKETQIPLELNAIFQPKVPITLKFIPSALKKIKDEHNKESDVSGSGRFSCSKIKYLVIILRTQVSNQQKDIQITRFSPNPSFSFSEVMRRQAPLSLTSIILQLIQTAWKNWLRRLTQTSLLMFSPECKSEMNQYAFLPFGLGPRNCIGMRFAQMIMKLLVLKLLQNFSMETCKETQIPLEMNAAFQPKVPITVKFMPRSRKKKQ
ncbi:bifunctional protein STORR-like [Sinocyclocheilus rhinocerous]|uniref:bifunctional protein STORR-like n=1 Tax=Sinocyclocheilus rhinocerous TaxID=307959 RepID=UPI0007B9361E|nr:PREDICTED: bifunctional protein STORR-like [Sinocyclocheilus rhinocerous]